MKNTSKVFKALSDPTRIRILKMLETRTLCVCEIQYVIKGSQPNISHHLKTLYEAGLVESRKDGLWISYSIPQKPESPFHAAALSLMRKALAADETVKKDRTVVNSVNRLEITCRR